METSVRHRSALRSFLASEASGGILLIAAAALAMALANGAAAPIYFHALNTYLGPLSVLHWVNDALMAVFFFLVGLEVKREMVDGNLSTWRDRRLPIVAAAGGMAIPAAIYVIMTSGTPSLLRGWAIPAATDIAFALGVLALLGSRAPASLKLFLTSVAVVDDIGAVAIIAIAYTASLNVVALLAALLILMLMFGINRAGEKRLGPFLALSLALWFAVLLSGVHPTVAGVLAALTIPLDRSPGAPDSAHSLLHRLEHLIQPWVAYLIVPLFGFANAGVSLRGFAWQTLFAPLPLGIATALFIGKQIGIFGSVRAAVALGIAKRPRGTNWLQIYGVSLLCGIGFTMSLFIGGLAFEDPALADAVKIGVLGGSILSAAVGYFVFLAAAPTQSLPGPRELERSGSRPEVG